MAENKQNFTHTKTIHLKKKYCPDKMSCNHTNNQIAHQRNKANHKSIK